MASLRKENDRGRKGWRIQFRDADKRRRSIWLGNIEEQTAAKTKPWLRKRFAAELAKPSSFFVKRLSVATAIKTHFKTSPAQAEGIQPISFLYRQGGSLLVSSNALIGIGGQFWHCADTAACGARRNCSNFVGRM